MLGLAIRAQIPIIHCTTTDTLNIRQVLEALASESKVMDWKEGNFPTGDLFFATEEPAGLDKDLYERFVENDKVLVLVNCGDESPLVFSAGEMPVPQSLMRDQLSPLVTTKLMPEILPCFSGLTLKQAAEVIRLTMVASKSLSARAVMAMRSQLIGKQRGLEQVNTELSVYQPPAQLSQWVHRNRKYFIEAVDERLVPRGMLLYGEPGVGKSTAAKFISQSWGVTLYRLDLSSALSKWVSESEANFSRVLSTIDQEEPCALLIDEVEKVFSESDDAGVTPRLLSQLLWWLAEHRSRVLTIMTSNDMTKLPKELYRAGRLDEVVKIASLDVIGSHKLATTLLQQFTASTRVRVHMISLLKKRMGKSSTPRAITHADVLKFVYDYVKEQGIKK